MNKHYASPDVSVDIVLLTLKAGKLHVALHVREKEPCLGRLALPGGYVHVDDESEVDLEATAYRVLKEKTGLVPRYLEQLKTFSGKERDPTRGWTVAVSHVALIPLEELAAVGEGVFHFYEVDALPELAFDHAKQVAEAVQRVRNKSNYSTLPCWLLPERFTLTQLQHTYEEILGETWPRATFRSRLGIKVGDVMPGESADNADILVATEEYQRGNQRPARLFKVNQLSLLKRTFW